MAQHLTLQRDEQDQRDTFDQCERKGDRGDDPRDPPRAAIRRLLVFGPAFGSLVIVVELVATHVVHWPRSLRWCDPVWRRDVRR